MAMKTGLKMNGAVVTRAVGLRSVSADFVVAAALASGGALSFGLLAEWPVWLIGLVTLLPWVPVFVAETLWSYRHYPWLALFYILVVTQTGHVGEHMAQVIQIHVLNRTGARASGIFGALNIELVHFIMNTWVGIAVILLLVHFRVNPWLWVTLILCGWHEVEHLVVFWDYLRTGVAGSPGLLADGGVIGGGLPLSRADLHFFYNLLETAPLLISFAWQLARTAQPAGELVADHARGNGAA